MATILNPLASAPIPVVDYAELRQLDLQRQALDHEEMFLNTDAYISGLPKEDQDALSSSWEWAPDPESSKRKSVNRGYIGDFYGLPDEALGEGGYQTYRDRYAKEVLGVPQGGELNEDSFFELMKEKQQKQKDYRGFAEYFATDALNSSLLLVPKDPYTEAARIGADTKMMPNMGKEESDLLAKHWVDQRLQYEERVSPLRPKAQEIYDMLAKGKDEGLTPDSKAGIEGAIDQLAMLAPDDRKIVVAMLKSQGGTDTTGALTDKLVMSAVRGLAGQFRGYSSNTERGALLLAQSELNQGGGLVIRDGETVDLAVSRRLIAAAPSTTLSLGPYAGIGEAFAGGRAATPEEVKQAQAIIDRKLTRSEVAQQAIGILEGTIDPIKPNKKQGTGLLAATGAFAQRTSIDVGTSFGAMAPMMLPMAGVMIAQGGYADDEYEKLREEGNSPAAAHMASQLTGALQAGFERAAFLFNFVPSSTIARMTAVKAGSKLMGLRPALETSTTFRILSKMGTIQAAEYGEEVAQAAAPILTGFLGENLGWNMAEQSKFLGEWQQFKEEGGFWRPEVFATVMVLAVAGGGYQGLSQSVQAKAAMNTMLGDQTMLEAMGIAPKKAAEIVAMPETERQAAYQAAYPERNPSAPEAVAAQKLVTAEVDAQKAKGAAEVQAMESEGLSITRTADGWAVTDLTEPDTAPIPYATAEEAMTTVRGIVKARGMKRQDTFLDALDEYVSFMESGRTIQLSNKSTNLLKELETAVTQGNKQWVEDIWDRADQERTKIGLDVLERDLSNPDSAVALFGMKVLGRSKSEAKGNVAKAISYVMAGGQTLDLVEEQAENDMGDALAAGETTTETVEAILRRIETFTGDKYIFSNTTQGIKEAWAAVVRLYTTGTRKGNKITKGARQETAAALRIERQRLRSAETAGVTPSAFAKMREYLDYLKGIMGQVYRLQKARDAGLLDDLEAMIRESVGLKEQDALEAKVAESVPTAYNLETGQGTSTLGYSVSALPSVDSFAAQDTDTQISYSISPLVYDHNKELRRPKPLREAINNEYTTTRKDNILYRPDRYYRVIDDNAWADFQNIGYFRPNPNSKVNDKGGYAVLYAATGGQAARYKGRYVVEVNPVEGQWTKVSEVSGYVTTEIGSVTKDSAVRVFEKQADGTYKVVLDNIGDQALFDPAEQGTGYSISAKRDADYMAAVESGDTVKQRTLVDDAAKAAGIPYVGVNINDSDENYTGMILSGEKTVETRNSENNAFRNLVGERVAIVRTGTGKATVVGYATVGTPIRYNSAEEFNADFARHRVTGGKFAFSGFKIGYPMENVTPIDAYEAPPANGQTVIKTRPIHALVDYDDKGNVIPLSERFDLEQEVDPTSPATEPGEAAPNIPITNPDEQTEADGWQDIPWTTQTGYAIQYKPEAYPPLTKEIYDKIKSETDNIYAVWIDRMKVGSYKGIDLQGGMFYPAIEENLKAGVVWAYNADGVASGELKKAAQTGGYMKLILMQEGNVIGNKTFTACWFLDVRENIANGKLTSDKALEELNRVRVMYQNKTEHTTAWETLEQAEKEITDMGQIVRGATYFQKSQKGGRISYSALLAQKMVKNGFPDGEAMVSELEEPAMKGLPIGTMVGIIQIDPNQKPTSAQAAGVTPHRSYKTVLKGRPIARMTKFNTVKQLFPEVPDYPMNWSTRPLPLDRGVGTGYSITTAARHAEYLKARESGNRNVAQRLVNQEAGVQSVDASIDRNGAHSPSGPQDGAPIWDATANGIYPDDIYTQAALRYYGTGDDAMDREAHSLIQSFRGNPNRTLKVYRALEKDGPKKIQPGEWVTTVRAYAKEHGMNALNGDYKIISETVHARDIFTSGDSWAEWGYHPQPAMPVAVNRGTDPTPLSLEQFQKLSQGSSYSITTAAGLENIKAQLDKVAIDPDVRFNMMQRASENLAKMVRDIGFRDDVAAAANDAGMAQMEQQQATALAGVVDRYSAEEQQRLRADEEALKELKAKHETALQDLSVKADIEAGGAQADGWTADQKDALKVRQRLEQTTLQARQRAEKLALETKQQKATDAAKAKERQEVNLLKQEQAAQRKANEQKTGEREQRATMLDYLAALDTILMPFPAEVRNKVGGFVSLAGLRTNASMNKYLKDRVEKLNKVLETYMRKEYTIAMERLLKKAEPTKGKPGEKMAGKLGPDVQHLMDMVRTSLKWTAEDVNAHIAGLQTTIDGGTLTAEQEVLALREIELVQLAGDWTHADAAKRSAAVQAATETYEGGYLAWKAKLIAKREAREKIKTALITDTGKAGTQTERDERAKKDLGWMGKAKDFWLSLSSFEELTRYVFGEKSEAAIEMVDRERAAAYQYEDATTAMGDLVQQHFNDLAGGHLKGEQLRFRLSQKTINTPSASLSELEAIQAILLWNQEDGKRHMIGTLDENNKPNGAWHYNQDWVDSVMAQMTPEGKATMAFIQRIYAEEWATLNPLYRERHGVNLPRHENYAPITVAPVQAKGGEMVDPVSGAAMTGSILTPGSLRTRSRRAIAEPEFRDALQTMLAHTKQMEHWKAYYDFAVDAQAILGNRDVGNAVQAAAGKEGKMVMRKWLDIFSQGGSRDAGAALAGNRLLSTMSGRAARMALVGRVGTLLIQSTQLAAASAEMPVGAYVSRLGRLLSGNLGWKNAIRSEFIQRRIQQAPPIVRQAMEGMTSDRPNVVRQAANYLGTLISGADGLFTSGTYAILLDYHMAQAAKLNITGPEAADYANRQAERITERVAQPTRMGTRSLFENTQTSPLAKLGWAFASEARQKIALAAWAARNAKADPERAARVAFLTWVVGGLMAQVIRNAWKDLKDDDDDTLFDDRNWNLKQMVASTLSGPLQGIPGLGSAFQSVISNTAGTYNQQGNLLDGFGKSVPALKGLISGESMEDAEPVEEIMKDVEAILTAAGMVNETAASATSLFHLVRDGSSVLDGLQDDAEELKAKAKAADRREAAERKKQRMEQGAQ